MSGWESELGLHRCKPSSECAVETSNPHQGGYYLQSNVFFLVIRAATRSTFSQASAELNPADQRLLGHLLFQAWQSFSVKINILRVRGHLASVSTLVGVQKVHREPVSGRL